VASLLNVVLVEDQLRHFVSFGEEVCWVLVKPQRAMRFLAAALYDVYLLVVGTLLNGDLDIQFIGGSEPCAAFGVKDPVVEVVETFG
jgi:hypothetical protein